MEPEVKERSTVALKGMSDMKISKSVSEAGAVLSFHWYDGAGELHIHTLDLLESDRYLAAEQELAATASGVRLTRTRP